MNIAIMMMIITNTIPGFFENFISVFFIVPCSFFTIYGYSHFTRLFKKSLRFLFRLLIVIEYTCTICILLTKIWKLRYGKWELLFRVEITLL